jgi:hypothetical protein
MKKFRFRVELLVPAPDEATAETLLRKQLTDAEIKHVGHINSDINEIDALYKIVCKTFGVHPNFARNHQNADAINVRLAFLMACNRVLTIDGYLYSSFLDKSISAKTEDSYRLQNLSSERYKTIKNVAEFAEKKYIEMYH